LLDCHKKGLGNTPGPFFFTSWLGAYFTAKLTALLPDTPLLFACTRT
jgi:hypothetical protein